MNDKSEAILDEIETVGRRLSAAKEAISQRIYGQDNVIEETLITVLSGGHGLLVGVPGLAGDRPCFMGNFGCFPVDPGLTGARRG